MLGKAVTRPPPSNFREEILKTIVGECDLHKTLQEKAAEIAEKDKKCRKCEKGEKDSSQTSWVECARLRSCYYSINM